MVDDLIKKSSHAESRFYLNEMDQLIDTILQLEEKGQSTILIGVTYALLDLIENGLVGQARARRLGPRDRRQKRLDVEFRCRCHGKPSPARGGPPR